MQYIYQAYIGKRPISHLAFYRTIDDALESAMDVIRYECGTFESTVVCKPVEIKKSDRYPYYICKVFQVKIIEEEFDEELGSMEVYIRYKHILIKEMTLMD